MHWPANRPKTGQPPFTWEDSARDALDLEGFLKETDWSVPHLLYLLEQYNGFGPRFRGLATAYLWSYSNLYASGKYVKDGPDGWDPNAVSSQPGAASLLKRAMDRNIVP